MACNPQDLVNPSLMGSFLPGQMPYVEAALLCNIKQVLEGDEDVSCDPQSIADEMKCLMCNFTPNQIAYVRAQLLCDIATLLGGGIPPSSCSTASKRHYGSGDPEGVVEGCRGEIYVDVDTGTLWVKVSGDNTDTGWV